MKIKKITRNEFSIPTADIEVENTHSYQLGNGTVVHNTTSKLFGLTEGWHLPSKEFYLRWVQFRSDDPLVQTWQQRGYPVRHLTKYEGTSIVGFPTALSIASLGMGNAIVTAAEATPEEQYTWIRLGEKYWIQGVEEDGSPSTAHDGNQISYTLKYFPDRVDHSHFRRMILKNQPSIRCCSVMPQADVSAYEYQPEEIVTRDRYEEICRGIHNDNMHEKIDRTHVDCETGGCPVDFREDTTR